MRNRWIEKDMDDKKTKILKELWGKEKQQEEEKQDVESRKRRMGKQ